MRLTRRAALFASALPAFAFAPVARALPARTLHFPRDFGSHPELRTEWWYVTGEAWAGTRRFGFQLTFFRSRVDETQGLRSAFAARQLVFAHAALTDLQGARLLHDQRLARAGFGIAEASEEDTDLRLRDWRLRRDAASGAYDAHLPAEGFALRLRCAPTQPLLLQGQAGLSRKGPEAAQASYYYSEPQLAVSGSVALADGRPLPVRGTAWLDHEWSEALMHPEAVGWDWIGMNLQDGASLTAFRLRRRDGSTLWTGGSWRASGGAEPRSFGADALRFEALRTWTSPRSGGRYPVRWRVQTPVGEFEVASLLDDQELDSRSSTGAIYWEGLSELRDAQGRVVGRGYLEMTGYVAALRL
ncbi:lipocalin-like domain-containing protein [Xenophilus sp. Marseille-Q4582]|uniref:lipocalin-like domain-containing protein n=1 Tax=Xenophilus sp. Marseille-Q4582 TaxID=2866600 RepID=UPI001CE40C93|nr:lipocalin-like domain-containing protein [Xenophilus sp. Marseille-Q4582]